MTLQAIMAAMQSMQGAGYGIGQGDWGQALGALPGGGGLLGGYLSGRHARKQERKLKKNIGVARRTTQSIFGRGLAQQEALSRKATGQELGGYDTARKETERLGRSSKQQALDQESRMGASISQDLASKGLGSTTVGANLQRGLASDTSRSMQGINEGLASMMGNLAIGRGGVESQGTQNLADLAGQRTNFDINNAQFWLPQHLSQLGQLQGLRMGGGQVGGGAAGGMGGIDMNMLMKIFGQMGGQGGGMGGGFGSGGFQGAMLGMG